MDTASLMNKPVRCAHNNPLILDLILISSPPPTFLPIFFLHPLSSSPIFLNRSFHLPHLPPSPSPPPYPLSSHYPDLYLSKSISIPPSLPILSLISPHFYPCIFISSSLQSIRIIFFSATELPCFYGDG